MKDTVTNNKYIETMKEKGMVISGTLSGKNLVEIIELRNHPWFVATQFHPQFKSRPHRPQSLFKGFIGATLKYKNK